MWLKIGKYVKKCMPEYFYKNQNFSIFCSQEESNVLYPKKPQIINLLGSKICVADSERF